MLLGAIIVYGTLGLVTTVAALHADKTPGIYDPYFDDNAR